MSIQDIVNYRQISETLASSGQPEESQFKEIAAAGYEFVINLAMPNSDNAIPEEGYIVTARRMTYVHLPVPFDKPTPGQLKTFFNLMAAFSGKKCWIHCVVNMRVSAFLFLYYKLILGVAEEEAKKVVIPDWTPDNVWREFMALEAGDVGL